MPFDGNAEQIRSIFEQVVDARMRTLPTSPEFNQHVDKRIDERVDTAIAKLKLWLFGSLLANVACLLPIIFFLGGIYSTNSSALQNLEKQQAVIAARGDWMAERESWEQAVEIWAGPQGFRPPRERQRTP